MKFAKSLLAVATGLAIAVSANAADDGKLKIGMSFQEMNNPYFVTMQEALEEACASIGAEVVVTDARHDI